jgi:hypothetical protein
MFDWPGFDFRHGLEIFTTPWRQSGLWVSPNFLYNIKTRESSLGVTRPELEAWIHFDLMQRSRIMELYLHFKRVHGTKCIYRGRVCWIGRGEQCAGPARDSNASHQGGGGDPEGTASSGRALAGDPASVPGVLQATDRGERTPVFRVWLAGVQREL